MAHLFGIVGAPPIHVGPSATVEPGTYLYRRTGDYYYAANSRTAFFGSPTTGYEFASSSEEETEEGSIQTHWVTRASGDNGSFTPYYGGMEGEIETNDERVTYSLSEHVSTADFLEDIPADRFEITDLFITSDYTTPFAGTTEWYFAPPLPLQFAFLFEDDTYTVGAAIRFNTTTIPHTYAGRFVHGLPTYIGGSHGECAVDGTIFSSLAEETAHNSLAFTLGEGATSTTFNETFSEATFDASVTSGELPYAANSEVAGATEGRAFFPAIVRVAATWGGSGRLTVDCSNTISPTANVTGIYLEDGASPFAGFLGQVDHFEVGATTYPGETRYIPSTTFDIVFKDEGSPTPGYVTLYAVVDADGLPPTSTALEEGTFPFGFTAPTRTSLQANAWMSISALLKVTAQSGGAGRFIVRASGEIKRRPRTTLWQHTGTARIWGMERGNGAIYKSDDEGTTYDEMTPAWTDTPGAVAIMGESLGDGGAMSIAKVGDELWFRISPDNVTWEDPAPPVADYGAGGWCVREKRASNEGVIIIENTETTLISTDTGQTWEVSP